MASTFQALAFGDWVPGLVRQSNRMAGIDRDPSVAEIAAHRGLLAAETIGIGQLERFVHHVAGGGLSPAGPDGRLSTTGLEMLLMLARTRAADADELMRLLRLVRPFTVGNGRCGRALWMWRTMRGTKDEVARLTAPAPFGSQGRQAEPVRVVSRR